MVLRFLAQANGSTVVPFTEVQWFWWGLEREIVSFVLDMLAKRPGA